ncbi:MAG: HAD family hydrolase [Anaerocolumna sp.]
MIKGILFDKDGTLLEFFTLWHGIIGKVLSELEIHYAIQKETIEELKQASGFRKNKFEKESRIQYLATSQIADMWYEIINKVPNQITYHELKNLFEVKALSDNLEIKALEGVRELLAYLKVNGYTLGVATADTKLSTCNGLNKAGIIDYFDYIGCNEEGINPKPSPDMAFQFCHKMNLKTDELLIIGDSVTDMEFADNAKAQFIGIKTDYNDYQEFTKHNKSAVDKIQDIVQIMAL